MEEGRDEVVLALSREEVLELFSRCLRSADEDNAVSSAALKKLAVHLSRMPHTKSQSLAA